MENASARVHAPSIAVDTYSNLCDVAREISPSPGWHIEIAYFSRRTYAPDISGRADRNLGQQTGHHVEHLSGPTEMKYLPSSVQSPSVAVASRRDLVECAGNAYPLQ